MRIPLWRMPVGMGMLVVSCLPAGVAEAQGLFIRNPASVRFERPVVSGEDGAFAEEARWRISVTLGTTGRGPASQVEEAMIRAGFDKRSTGSSWAAPRDHPFSVTGLGKAEASWTVQLTQSIGRHLEGGVLVGRSAIGKTDGYRTDPSVYLGLQYVSMAVSPMVFVKGLEILRVGLGPGLFVNRMEQEYAGTSTYSEQKTQWGAVFQAVALYPANSGLFVKADLQYRLIPGSEYGPVESAGETPESYLDAFRAGFSHLFAGFGFGFSL